jgi:hypothetical protein
MERQNFGARRASRLKNRRGGQDDNSYLPAMLAHDKIDADQPPVVLFRQNNQSDQ